MSKTRTVRTPIKCPRCGENVNGNCPACKGTGLVYIEDVTVENYWDGTKSYNKDAVEKVPQYKVSNLTFNYGI